MKGERVILAAHRGDRVRHPENTMAAFKAALDFGADMIETDIRMTRDGELVLIHDRSTERTAGVNLNVDELTLAECREINVGATFGEGRIERIPTVREFLDLICDTGMLVNWEFKVYPSDFGDGVAFTVVDKLMSLISEYRMEERSMMNSFSVKTLDYIYKKWGKKFPIHGQGIGACSRAKDKAETPDEMLFDWCCLYPSGGVKDKAALDFPENFKYCTERGIIPCICVRDELEAYRRAIDLGCRMFTSNNIYLADEILRKLGVR